MPVINIKQSLRQRALICLQESDPDKKVQTTYALFDDLQNCRVEIDKDFTAESQCLSGNPQKPELVPAYQLPKRGMGSLEGHAALIHSFAHIEFNAINIAWDAVYRFANMPEQYYRDWAEIAKEEAYHFQLINDYLKTINYEYGSFQAHNDLWEMVKKTAHDVMVRMALVPRVLEARGLDVTPSIISRFKHHGYDKAVEILEIIYRDEIGHVEKGSHWFKYLCEQRGLNPEQTFIELIRSYATDKIRKPFNDVAREQAGFTDFELELLNSWQQQ